MNKIDHILVPVDFSDCADNAFRYALEVAKKHQSKIHVLSVAQSVAYATEYPMAVDYFSKIEDVKTSLEEFALKMKADLSEDIDCVFEALEGDVVSNIIDYTKESSIDLIIMGTMGASGAIDKFFGSNSAFVVEKAECPVIVVPNSYEFGTGIQDVVLAYDYKDILSHKELDTLCGLMRTFKANLEVLKVVNSHREVTPEEEEAVKNIDDYFHQNQVQFKYAHVRCDDVIKGINHHVKMENVDMMVVIPQEHKFLDRLFHKSVSKELLFEPKVPVMVLHEIVD